MAEKLTQRGTCWYYRFTDADGKRRMQKGCTDKRATEEMLRRAETEAARIRSGVVDPRDLAYRDHEARPLEDHLAEFQRALIAKGDTRKHAQVTAYRARRI